VLPPFSYTQSFQAPGNITRVDNLGTQQAGSLKQQSGTELVRGVSPPHFFSANHWVRSGIVYSIYLFLNI